MKVKSNTIVIFAILCIAFIETLAILQGINGQLLRWTMIIIAGLAGWRVPWGTK